MSALRTDARVIMMPLAVFFDFLTFPLQEAVVKVLFDNR